MKTKFKVGDLVKVNSVLQKRMKLYDQTEYTSIYKIIRISEYRFYINNGFGHIFGTLKKTRVIPAVLAKCIYTDTTKYFPTKILIKLTKKQEKNLKQEILLSKIQELHVRQPFYTKFKKKLPTWQQTEDKLVQYKAAHA